MIKRLVLFGSSVLVVFIFSVGLDRLTGLFASSHDEGLNFPRNVTRHFQTPEFSFTVTTNSLGLEIANSALKRASTRGSLPSATRSLMAGESRLSNLGPKSWSVDCETPALTSKLQTWESLPDHREVMPTSRKRQCRSLNPIY